VEWRQWPSVEAATITVKELLPIVLAAAVWGGQWRGRMVLCPCDHQAVVMALRGGLLHGQCDGVFPEVPVFPGG